MDISPIRDDADHANALAEIERLWGAEARTPEGDKLDVLVTLVAAYEDERWPIDPVHPVDVIEYAMQAGGRTQADLSTLLGSRSRASEILARKRPLTLNMILKLSRSWRIPAEILIGPYDLHAKTKRTAGAKQQGARVKSGKRKPVRRRRAEAA